MPESACVNGWKAFSPAEGKRNAKRLLKVIAGQMTPQQIAEAERRAEDWRAAN